MTGVTETKAAEAKSPAAEATSDGRRSVREKRPMDKFKSAAPAAEEPAEFKILPGKGTELGSIESFNVLLNRHRTTDPVLVAAHRLCYGRVGKATTRKRDLRKFSGLWDCNRDQARVRAVRVKPFKLLKDVAELFGCLPSGANTIDSLADAVADFLMKPQDSGREVPPSKSEKLAKVRASKQAKKERSQRKKEKARKEKEKEKKAKAGTPKRPPTAFLLFSIDRQPAIRKKHPDWKITEVSQRVAKEWGRLEAEDKKPYEKKARKLKEKYEEEMKEWARKQKGKKAKDSTDKKKAKKEAESSEEEDESEQESEEEEEPQAKKQRKEKADGKEKKKAKAKKDKDSDSEGEEEEGEEDASEEEEETPKKAKSKAKETVKEKQKEKEKEKGKEKEKKAKEAGKKRKKPQKEEEEEEEEKEEAEKEEKEAPKEKAKAKADKEPKPKAATEAAEPEEPKPKKAKAAPAETPAPAEAPAEPQATAKADGPATTPPAAAESPAEKLKAASEALVDEE